MSAGGTVEGICDARFEAVREAFAGNLTERGDIGAAVCVSLGGRVVVDLWGGWADEARTRAWERETLVNVFSIGKGLTATCAAHLVGRGLLDVDEPVARRWPEFAAGGKDEITLRQLLSHQGGLPAVRRRLPPGAMLDWRAMTDALAAQDPWWEPGTAHGYHVNTFGFLVGEVLRRAAGCTVGELLQQAVAGPLDADVHIGLPAGEHARVADFVWPGQPGPADEKEPPGLTDAQLMEFNAYWNPIGLSGGSVVNTADWRTAEIPSTNAHATARGVSRVYAALANGGELDGARVVELAALREAVTEQAAGEDLILHRATRFGLGYQLTQPERPLGPNAGSFGHFGAGGSLGFCDPDTGLAFGYVMNAMGPRWQNPRNLALLGAVFESLA